MPEFGDWFRRADVDMKWLCCSPAGVASRCDNRYSHVVPANAPRLMVDSDVGPIRKRGKGKRHEYLCVACARERYGVTPPSMLYTNQEWLFK